MPVERLSHPSDGTSQKLCALSDFEFRVWHQYRLCANDLGVMLDSPAPLMAENRVLEHRKAPAVSRALRRIVELGLLVRFEHQGVGFVCSPLWQDFQKIRYPRASHLPRPTGAELAACSIKTRELFRQRCGEVSEEVQENPEPPTRGPARNANANASAALVLVQGEPEREPKPADLIAARFETFWDAYGRRGGRKPAEKAFWRIKPDHELLTVMLDAIARQKLTRQWRDGFAPHAATWLNGERWTDEVTEDVAKQVPAARRTHAPSPPPEWQAHCPHRPPCLIVTSCPEAWAWLKEQTVAETEVPA